ncbi:CueP family metal-binding protein [Cellulomonas sp. ATA003]|uniref:CueP family metal-binding protein n=1 Tax=Cellulomonas sp. ATA003 TaxID=3073064 RepID=UPI002872BC1A|nr:CueP family metal-binding protein [Cellulomonas sp. ATA003]WNB86556.1 CueP family metal-binding protein [Cellulomonas sp. ATA003]
MRRPIAAATLGLLILAGCSTTGPGAAPADALDPAGVSTGTTGDLLAAYELTGMDAPAIIDHLDRLPLDRRPTDLMASVRPDALLLGAGDDEVVLDIPDDRFYVSVAPYADGTHDCFFHSLTTCRGEMPDEEIDVRIVDDATGEVLVDETTTTFDNGFAGFWLPRDVEGSIEVTVDGRTGTAAFSTTADGATCITTLRVA